MHKENISKLLGTITKLSIRLKKQGHQKDFRELTTIIEKNQHIKSWISISIPSVLYTLYKEDKSWFDSLEWSFSEKLPIFNQYGELPLSFSVAKDGEVKVLQLFITYGYDLNERFLIKIGNHSEFISIYNIIEDSKLIPYLYNGGWRPTCVNKGSDLPNILLNEELLSQDIKDILASYFVHDNPNNCLIDDDDELLGKIDLLGYISKRWTNQDISIIDKILEDPRWDYDVIYYASIRCNSVLNKVLEEGCDTHDNRPVLYTGKMYIWDYIYTLSDRQQTAYSYILEIIADHENINSDYNSFKTIQNKDDYLYTSSEAYEYMNEIWIECISDYLPDEVSPYLLYNPRFGNEYCKYLSKWSKNRDLILPQLLYCYDIHNILRIQVNFISWIYDNYFIVTPRLKMMYMDILR